ncbi:MAG: hypothetical protein IPL41_01615 [Micropruina sp.]|nr:hypothetical protein [Micropruina sp.]
MLVDANLSGVIVGQSLASLPEDQYRALMEATAFGLREIVEAFDKAGSSVVASPRGAVSTGSTCVVRVSTRSTCGGGLAGSPSGRRSHGPPTALRRGWSRLVVAPVLSNGARCHVRCTLSRYNTKPCTDSDNRYRCRERPEPRTAPVWTSGA